MGMPPPIEDRTKLVSDGVIFNIACITTAEVEHAIRKLHTNKAPGPDGCTTELFKYLDRSNIQTLCECLNVFWQQAFVPDDFTKTKITSLYKKGEHDNPENYRRISLLNTVYKIYVYIIKNRITEHTGETQFGFRKGKSTAEPIFCVRCLTHVAEQGHEPLWLLFLDWEKAFDKLDHAKMFVTLSRLRMPENLIEIIKSCPSINSHNPSPSFDSVQFSSIFFSLLS